MRNPFHTPFAAVFWNEVLVNTKRVGPYALMILFSANAILWWGWGPAVSRGWATNSDWYIYRNLGAFNFILGLPIFTAIMMGDPVIRDFRLGVDPLIFSKPVSRASYLLGKFFGAFFVLVCCQSAYVITVILLQWVPFSGMVTQPVRVVPYFKHFFFVVVVSHLVLAAFYFAAGTITRNAKIVYGLAACFYPAYVSFQLMWKGLPANVRTLLDPVAFNFHSNLNGWAQSADFLNKHVVSYGPYAYANRALMLIYTATLLFIVYRRFSTLEQTKLSTDHFTFLTLPRVAERVPSYGVEISPSYTFPESTIEVTPARDRIPLPNVTTTRGLKTTFLKILAAAEVEFRLLRSERSLIILFPLVIVLSIFDLTFFRVVPEISYSVTYASGTANALLLFLVGLVIFFTGEAIHRDREVKVQSIIWSTPAPNSVLLLSKFFATALLSLALLAVVGLISIVIQVFRGHTPVDFTAYVMIYGVVVAPSIVFMSSMVVALNVSLRNKYVTYVVEVGAAAGLLYLYSVGHNHWLYNPLLYRLWTYDNLFTGTMLTRRLYCFGLAVVLLALAHLVFQRKST